MTIAREELVLALAPSLGEEKSIEVVLGALTRLGYENPLLDATQVDAVLDLLASEAGLVGVAARVAKQRSRVFADEPQSGTTGESSSSTRRSMWPRGDARIYESSSTLRAPSIPPSGPPRFRAKDLARMLAPTIGDARAVETVAAAVGKLGVSPTDMSQEEALDVLEALAGEPGTLGVTARFAKARLLLKA